MKRSKKESMSLIKRAAAMAVGSGDSSDRWKPKKAGDGIEGEVVSIEERTGEDDTFRVCFLRVSKDRVTSFALNKVLGNLFDANEIEAGDRIGVVFKGLSKKTYKGGNKAKLFTLAIDGRETVNAPMQKSGTKRRKSRK